MFVRRLLTVVLLSGSVGLALATPAYAADKTNKEIEECVAKAATAKTDPQDCLDAPSPILPSKNEIIWGGGAFLVLFVLMAKFAFPSVKKGMDARTNKIRGDLDNAEQAKTEANQILEQYQRQLADAKAESNRILEEARNAAEAMRRDLTARAEEEAAELRERNQTEIIAAKDRMLIDLRSDVADMAIELAEKVVEKNLDKKTNSALIDQYISQVGAGK